MYPLKIGGNQFAQRIKRLAWLLPESRVSTRPTRGPDFLFRLPQISVRDNSKEEEEGMTQQKNVMEIGRWI
jgi:hypothetical protein